MTWPLWAAGLALALVAGAGLAEMLIRRADRRAAERSADSRLAAVRRLYEAPPPGGPGGGAGSQSPAARQLR